MRRWPLVALALALASGCTCSGRPAAAPASEAEPGREEPRVRPVYAAAGALPLAQRLCDALHALPAARRAACCRSAPGIEATELCVNAVSAALGSGAVALSPGSVARCEEAMAHALEGCSWVGPLGPELPPACRGLLTGRLAEGALCRSSLECRAGLRCRGAGPTQSGQCEAPGEAGSRCDASVDVLGALLRDGEEAAHPQCAGSCVHHRCAPRVARGAACASSAQCGPGARCGEGRCISGERGTAGEPCAGGDCAPGLRCVAGTCRAPLADGAPCASDFDCAGGCVQGPRGRICGMRCDVR